VVVEENAIVSSIEFVEGAGGASSMVGQFVSATSSKAYTGGGGAGGRGGRYGFSRASRESTLANGRRRIQDVASRLRLGSHYVDAAHRLFTIAVEKNFVQGRRTTHVVAACLYIACRQEKSQHMLIDFSDALQVNVYVLGTCFLKFRRLLGLKLVRLGKLMFLLCRFVILNLSFSVVDTGNYRPCLVCLPICGSFGFRRKGKCGSTDCSASGGTYET
jgi:transcription factor IIIB subunit 2